MVGQTMSKLRYAEAKTLFGETFIEYNFYTILFAVRNSMTSRIPQLYQWLNWVMF